MFGPEIGALVEGLTKLKRLELVSREAKQAENLRKLLLAISDDVRVLLIKLADRLHNMRTLEFVPPAARRRIAEETLDIYAPLAGRMGMQEMREELEELSFRTIDPEAYAVVTQRLDSLEDRNRNLIGEIESQLIKNLEKNGMAAHVYGRRKRPFSIWTKMKRKSVGFEQLSDIFGFRVVMNDVEACYRALGVVHTTWPVAWSCKSVPPRWTRSPNTASPRTPSTRRASGLPPNCLIANPTRLPGCATPSRSCPKVQIRKNSSNTPSSNCFTIRCSASPRRGS
jgi:GTP pyrophosphokinase/guanosine-3',5'-bis(diphosphate) 3'-pyrophosphohydrolase